MTQETRRNVSASVHQRLLNISRMHGENDQLLRIRFATERFLYRLSRSAHAQKFILKGAMLFAVWSETPFRPTRDVDFLATGEFNQETLRSVILAVIQQPVKEDGLRFDEAGIRIEEIREMDRYNGMRIRLKAFLGNIEIPVQIDLGFGDVVTPNPIFIDYPALLDFPSPHLKAYPPETVVAEKFEAIVKHGLTNSRMKDYYDLVIICDRFPLKQKDLIRAVKATFERRQTPIPANIPVGLSDEFGEDRNNQILWKRFLERNSLQDVSDDLLVTVRTLRVMCMDVLRRISAN